MVLLAFSLQDQIEKYGAYVGILAFFGLAILSLLYFAQAREVKRLRDWAGRAPERAAELEALAIERAEEVRRAPAPAPAAQPAPATAAAVAVAANGAAKLAPAEVAALAFARAAGVHTPHSPRPHPAPAAVPAVEVAAAGAATATGDAAAVEDLAPASNGHGTGTVPPPVAPGGDSAPAEPAVPGPATPAARQAAAPAEAAGEEAASPRVPAPAPAAPLRATPPPRRTASRRPTSARPARRESSARAVVLTTVVGVLVLGAAAFAVTQLFGGGDDTPAKPPKVAESTPASPSSTATSTAQSTPAPSKATMRVAVYNGTVQSNLAGGVRDQLVNLGYNPDNVGADTYTPNQQRQASVVMYERGERPAAATVARNLQISDVRLVDSTTQQLIDQSGKKWDVVVIVGADKSQ